MTQDNNGIDEVASRVKSTEPHIRDRLDNPKARELREKLNSQEFVFAPGTYHARDARLAEMTGPDAVYRSGYSPVPGQVGFPEPGLVAIARVVTNANLRVA